MPIASVVADANVLLSAIIGKAALRVFEEFDLSVHTTQFNRNEVLEYLPRLAGKYRLAQIGVELQLGPSDSRCPLLHYRRTAEGAYRLSRSGE
ncbi:MAG TPA: hypothetical protein VNW71_20045 [Thermoanaerobaculia bacterium]|nr:hypothetical protein [Thermoanaerobaculia bacterium]